ncbi:E3 ubiquitin-protein ligase Praja-2-like [Patiria miniata]|uniref:RING-type E3 ubiquitin transferase n=1 Tax=Patiria miniata TaxID=46514 RepID=A0A914A4F0_PATMI|nr:E3 ubiquitin-protein ligase Praja-2-like [Patiria miniata]
MSSSSNGGRGLPSINSSRGPRPSNDKTTERRSKNLPGRSLSPQRGVNISQTTPRAKKNLSSRLPPQQESLGENRHRPSIHNRTGRSFSTGIEDVDPSRNWNSEGGRPKRERTFSEKSNSRRLLQRSSINSSGELIPFQRAPRDGSYESHLPVSKKTTPQNLTRQSSLYSLTDREERLSARLQESPESNEEQSNNSLIENASKSQSLSYDERKKQRGKVKVANKSIDSRREGSRIMRKMSSQEVGHGIRKAPSESAPRGRAQSDVTSPGLPSLRKTEQSTNYKSEKAEQNKPAGILVPGLEENREITNYVEENNLEPDLRPDESSSQSVGSSNEPPIDNVFDEGDVTLAGNVHVMLPSAEFKAAAQSEDSTSTVTNSANHTVLQNTSESNLPAGCDESDIRINEQLSGSQQPNSVIRRRLNSVGTGDTSQIQSSQVLVSPSVLSNRQSSRSQNVSHSDDHASSGERPELSTESGSVNQQQPSPGVTDNTVSPRSMLAQPPPISNSTPSAGSTSQQARLNRFGRRIRIPSSDSVVTGESNQPDEQEARTVSEQSAEEQFEGTNRQRYQFFSLSRDISGTDREIQIPITPNRDLLYGQPPSPPLLRRHHRTHFGSGTSNLRQSSEEQGTSTSIQSSLGSSISNDDLDLHEDSFRTASGTAANFAPLLHSGPVLDSSSSTPHQRGRLHEVGPTSSMATLGSFSSSNSNSPRQLHLQSSAQSIDNVSDIERSSDYDQDNLTFSVEEGRLSRDARRRYQSDRSEAIPRLLSQRGRQPPRELSRGAEVMEDVFGSSRDGISQRGSNESPLRDATLELQIPLLSSPLFSPLGIAPGMLLSLLIRTRREFGQEFMELLLENMMLNVLAHHLFVGDQGGNEDGITGAPPPATQDIIDNLNEIPALESHIEKEMKCAICHSEYELYETLSELPCQHFFHPTCVAIWLKKSGTCPVCRFQLLSPAR